MPRLRLASAVQGSPAPLSNFLHYKLDEGLGMRLGKLGMRYITRLLPKLSPLRMEYIVRNHLEIEQGYVLEFIYDVIMTSSSQA